MRLAFAMALFALACARVARAGEVLLDVRDSAGKPVPDAVIYAEPIGAPTPALAGVPTASIDQVNKEFVPRVSVVRTGTSVSFPNSDNIRHQIYSFSPAKTFQTKLYAGREASPVVFDKPGLVTLGCNIHDTMVAWVLVVDTPWFAKSGADGIGKITLPKGEYKISAWYPAPTFAPQSEPVRVDSDAPLQRKITLAN
jgi:plastocyanin